MEEADDKGRGSSGSRDGKRHPRKRINRETEKERTIPVTLYGGGGERLSKKERREDALALGAEERRDKLRKAAGRSTYPAIRGCLNGETHMERLHVSITE